MKMKRSWIALAGILVLILAGCGKTEQPESPGVQRTAAVSDGQADSPDSGSGDGSGAQPVSWQASYTRLENQYDLALAAGDRIYGCLLGDGEVQIDQRKKEGSSVEGTITLPLASSISGLTADAAGNVYILENRDESVGLWKVGQDGGLSDRAELSLEARENTDSLSLKGIAADERGYLYVWCEMMVAEMEAFEGGEHEVWHFVDRVYVKDGQLKTIFYEEVDDVGGTQTLDFQIGTDGTPFFLVKDQEGLFIQEIDVDGEKLSEEVRLNRAGDFFDAESAGSLEHMVSTDNGFLFCRDNELFAFRYDTQEVERILSLTTYGIFSSDILHLAKCGDRIEIIDNHKGAGCSEFISLSLDASEKKELTLGTVMTVQDLERAVAEFNRYSGEYRVRIVDYLSQAESYEKAEERLKLDVVTGNAPDVIAVSGLDYQMFSEKGLLADLYDFMREDEAGPPEILTPSVARACEDGGRLYCVAPAFQLYSMWGYADVTGGRSGVGFAELSRLLEACERDVNAIAGFGGDEPVLTRLCALFMDEFVDWENGTCDFEGEYFKEMLSFAKEYEGIGAGGPLSQRIRKREVVLSAGMISSVADYQLQKELYGEELAFIGYPAAGGSGTEAAFMGSALAINAKNEDPAGAWEFVKYYLLQGYDGQGFPIVQEQFEQAIEDAMEEEYSEAEDGTKERFHKGWYNDGGGDIFVYAATQEEADTIIELVKSVGNRIQTHPAIQEIINEEAEMYFAGQADLERTAEKIQNRVRLLLQETFG